ncbi:MAG: 50S ribosomal protein L30 [Candidatus Magnetomorum sp.]|nr:50S ribosomal protein L30 [Candidatus Magnetomorum sp.]
MNMNQIKVTLIRSQIGRPEKHRKTLRALGLTKMHRSKVFNNTPSVRGMINQVNHLLLVEENTDESS